MEVLVEPGVFERHPDYVAVILLASRLTNGPSDDQADAALAAAEESVRGRDLERAVDHPHLEQWREAFRGFGAKPKKNPSSAAALAQRVLKGDPLPRVNRLVDLYNAVSARHLIPVGGEDADRLEGTLRLVVCTGGEPFDGADGPAAPGEIAWRDDAGVTCRRWNWRQGRRTALTQDTRRAFFVFDRLGAMPEDGLRAAVDDLGGLLRRGWPDCELQEIVLRAPSP